MITLEQVPFISIIGIVLMCVGFVIILSVPFIDPIHKGLYKKAFLFGIPMVAIGWFFVLFGMC